MSVSLAVTVFGILLVICHGSVSLHCKSRNISRNVYNYRLCLSNHFQGLVRSKRLQGSPLSSESSTDEPEILDTQKGGNVEDLEYAEQEPLRFGLFGGKTASIKDYPYTCAIIAETKHDGAAAIINKNWVLSTARTVEDVDPKNLLVRCGSDSAISKGQAIWANKIIFHDDYDEDDYDNDISLIKLKKPLKFGPTVKSIGIYTGKMTDKSNVVLSGFGLTNIKTKGKSKKKTRHDGLLRNATLSLLTYSSCQKYYKSDYTITNNSFCTGISQTVGPSYYDWGDPLIFANKLIGLFSGAPKYLDPKFPPVYTDVAKYRSWINKNIKK